MKTPEDEAFEEIERRTQWVPVVAEKATKEALAQPEQDWKIHPKEDAPLVKWAKEQTPPQRTWVGLTDIDYAGLPLEQVGLVRWAEATLKEKNT